jgi:hypothetical protein
MNHQQHADNHQTHSKEKEAIGVFGKFFDGILLKILLSLIVFGTPLILSGMSRIISIEQDIVVLKQKTETIERILEKNITELKCKIDSQTEEIIKLRIAIGK